MTTAEVLDHLRNRGLVVLEERRGALAQCPAHDDRRPSLRLTAGRDGRTLMVCRAGCRTEDVLTAAGLRLGDLFAAPAPVRPRRARPRSLLAWARAEAEAVARRQPWTRLRERYVAADVIHWAERVRRMAEDTDAGWELLAQAARVSTLAENILAGDA